jgi:hypothetical protein
MPTYDAPKVGRSECPCTMEFTRKLRGTFKAERVCDLSDLFRREVRTPCKATIEGNR